MSERAVHNILCLWKVVRRHTVFVFFGPLRGGGTGSVGQDFFSGCP